MLKSINLLEERQRQGVRFHVALASDGSHDLDVRKLYHDEQEYLTDFSHARNLVFCDRCSKVVKTGHVC